MKFCTVEIRTSYYHQNSNYKLQNIHFVAPPCQLSRANFYFRAQYTVNSHSPIHTEAYMLRSLPKYPPIYILHKRQINISGDMTLNGSSRSSNQMQMAPPH